MNGYGKDIKMAFFNASDEARFKLFKVIESDDIIMKRRYVVMGWTTTGSSHFLGRYPDSESAIAEFDKRVKAWHELEPQFKLVAES